MRLILETWRYTVTASQMISMRPRWKLMLLEFSINNLDPSVGCVVLGATRIIHHPVDFHYIRSTQIFLLETAVYHCKVFCQIPYIKFLPRNMVYIQHMRLSSFSLSICKDVIFVVSNLVMSTVLYLQNMFCISHEKYVFCVGLLKICILVMHRCILEFLLHSNPDFHSHGLR